MRNRIFSTIVAVASCAVVSAQGTCIINGHIADSQLADGKKIKKVYLTRTNELRRVTTPSSMPSLKMNPCCSTPLLDLVMGRTLRFSSNRVR